MTHEETKEEQNQTLSRVPLGIWQEFKIEAASQKTKTTMTELFIKMFRHWQKTKGAL